MYYTAHVRERWKPVNGHNRRYEISNFGRVRSWVAKGVDLPLIMTTQHDQRGRPQVNLSIAGRPKTIRVALLVARHFLPPPGPGLEVCHNDGDQWNCRADNLRYDTHSANILDAVRHGTHRSVSRDTCLKKNHPLDGRKTDWKTGRIVRYCKTCNREREAARRATS
jgi:hypothetical protein